MKIHPSLFQQIVLICTTGFLLTTGCNLDVSNPSKVSSSSTKVSPTHSSTNTTSHLPNTLLEEPKTLDTLLLVPPKKEENTKND